MKTTVSAIGGIVAIVAVVMGLSWLTPEVQPTALEYEREQIAIEHARATAPAWTIATYIIAIGGALLVIGIPASFAIAALARLRARQRLIMPNPNGIAPLLIDDNYAQNAASALAGFHHSEAIRASQSAQTPHTLHYSPRIEQHSASAASAPYALPLGDQPEARASVLSFADVLAGARGGRLCLGVDVETGAPVHTDFNGLFSAGIGGLQGSGKTWTCANILTQAALAGASLALIDLHAGDKESLATRLAPLSASYLFDVASTPNAAIAAIKQVSARLRARQQGDNDRSLLVLAFDEYTSTLRRLGADADQIADELANIASEGRKYGVFALLLAQNWNTESTGGSQIRNTLASALVHRMRASEARMLTGLPSSALPDDLLTLEAGEYYLLDTRGDLRHIRAPRIDQSDIVSAGKLLTDNAPTMGRLTPSADHMADNSELLKTLISQTESHKSAASQPAHGRDYTATERAMLTPEESQIVELFKSGLDAGAIVKELRGLTSKGGARYVAEVSQVQGVIRKVII